MSFAFDGFEAGQPSKRWARRIALAMFHALPAVAYQRMRRFPALGRLSRRVLDGLLPSDGFYIVRVRAGRLRGLALDIDPRVHKEMIVGRYEPHLAAAMEDILNLDDVAFDVGAHVGYFSLLMATCVGPGGRVIAFEPDPVVFHRLERSVRLNSPTPGGAIKPLAAAAGAVAGTGRFARGSDSSTGKLSDGGEFEVLVTTLDDTAAQHGIPSLVKIDVEGEELDTLRGAVKLLRTGSTSFIIEAHSEELERACVEVLGRYGYRTRRLVSPSRTDIHLLGLAPARRPRGSL